MPRAFTPVFAVLDPLRAVGALAVVTTHATFWTGDYLRHGIFGIACSPAWTSASRSSSCCPASCSPTTTSAGPGTACRADRPRRYFWKRFLRIYPAYLVAVVLAMLVRRGQRGRDALATGRASC